MENLREMAPRSPLNLDAANREPVPVANGQIGAIVHRDDVRQIVRERQAAAPADIELAARIARLQSGIRGRTTHPSCSGCCAAGGAGAEGAAGVRGAAGAAGCTWARAAAPSASTPARTGATIQPVNEGDGDETPRIRRMRPTSDPPAAAIANAGADRRASIAASASAYPTASPLIDTATSSQQCSRSSRSRPESHHTAGMVEEQCFGDRLEQVDEIVVASDVRELVSEDRVDLGDRQIRQRRNRNEDDRPDPADHGGRVQTIAIRDVHAAVDAE